MPSRPGKLGKGKPSEPGRHIIFTPRSVLSQMPLAFVYYFIGACLGTVAGFALFFTFPDLLAMFIKMWVHRLTIGVQLLNGNYTLRFIVNNLVALMMVVVMSVFMFVFILRKHKVRFKSLEGMERHNPKITLFSAYMLPIGALLINGFLVNLFITYTLFTYGIEKTTSAVLLMVPHGVNELVALLIATSLGLSYLKILAPMIRRKQFGKAIKTGKALLKSKTTMLFIVLILLLVVFSGFVEGVLTYFVL